MSVVAIFGKVVAVDGLVTEGDATRTVTDIMASQGLFRPGIASLVVVIALDVVVAWALYRVFSPGKQEPLHAPRPSLDGYARPALDESAPSNAGSRASTAATQRSMGSSITIEVKCVRKLSGGRGLTCVNTNVPPDTSSMASCGGTNPVISPPQDSPRRPTAGLDGARTTTAGM